MTLTGKTMLLVIDVQMAFAVRDQNGANRSMPGAEANISELLTGFRNAGLPVIHVHHHSRVEGSPFAKGLPGAQVQGFARPAAGEKIVLKGENSAFVATGLEADLRAARVTRLVICGATANHCVETTARMAGNLGFDVDYVADAVWAYDATGPDGTYHSAEDVHSMSLCNLDGEFARVCWTADVLSRLQ